MQKTKKPETSKFFIRVSDDWRQTPKLLTTSFTARISFSYLVAINDKFMLIYNCTLCQFGEISFCQFRQFPGPFIRSTPKNWQTSDASHNELTQLTRRRRANGEFISWGINQQVCRETMPFSANLPKFYYKALTTH